MGEIRVKVVTDTNILISALLFGGTPGTLISLWKKKCIIPFICKEMEDELLRVLAYPKFRLSKQEIEYLFYQEIMPYFQTVKIEHGEIIVKDDPLDDIFIHCAVAAGSEIIISGDKHLISLGTYRGNKDTNTPLRKFVTPLMIFYGLLKSASYTSSRGVTDLKSGVLLLGRYEGCQKIFKKRCGM